MRGLIISLVATAAALSVPGPALALQSSQVDNWTVGYDGPSDVCFMQTYYNADGVASSVRIELDYDGNRLLQINNNSWKMPTSDTSVEIWYSRSWERTADVVKTAKWHNTGSETHLDIALDTADISKIAATDWMIVRTSTNGLFKNYNLAKTSAAVSALWDCDAEWDDWW